MRKLMLVFCAFLLLGSTARADLAILVTGDTTICITGNGTYMPHSGNADEIVFDLFSSEVFVGQISQFATSITGGINFASNGFVGAVLDNGNNGVESGVTQSSAPSENIWIDLDQSINIPFVGDTYDFDVKMTFAPGALDFNYGTFSVGATDGFGDVSLTAVPEPGTAFAASGLLLAGLFRRRRK